MKNSKEQLMFEIDQLRKDRMLSAIESAGISMTGLLVFIGAPSVFPTIINPYDPKSLVILQYVVGVPLGFWLLVFVSNMIRMYQVMKLQKKLLGKK